jgi:hypothetical protein
MEHSTQLSVETLNPRTTKPAKECTNGGQEPYNDDADQNTEQQPPCQAQRKLGGVHCRRKDSEMQPNQYRKSQDQVLGYPFSFVHSFIDS